MSENQTLECSNKAFYPKIESQLLEIDDIDAVILRTYVLVLCLNWNT